MSKTSTALTLASLVTVLLSTVPGITSAHSTLSNSGNIIKSKLNSPCLGRLQQGTTLGLSPVVVGHPQSTSMGFLRCNGGLGVDGATITFTGTGVPANLVATTDRDGSYSVQFPTPTTPGTYTVQAHFAGLPGDSPSDSVVRSFTV